MRDPFFDVVKFLGMLLVVHGHVVRLFDCDFEWLCNFRVGMNMPLFFIIAGYFSKHIVETGDWRKFQRRIISYFWPLAVLSVMFAVLTVAFGLTRCETGVIGYAGRWFLFSAWFVWCLAFCLSIMFLCHLVRKKWLTLLLVSGAALGLYLLRWGWWTHDLRSMFPFFVFGFYVLTYDALWKRWLIGLPAVVIFILLVVFCGAFRSYGWSFYGVDNSFCVLINSFYALMMEVVRLLLGVIGSIGVMWFAWASSRKMPWVNRLAPFGTTTLGIYLLHPWMLEQIPSQSVTGGLFLRCCLSLAVTLAIYVFCHYFVLTTRKLAFLNRWLWGNEIGG